MRRSTIVASVVTATALGGAYLLGPLQEASSVVAAGKHVTSHARARPHATGTTGTTRTATPHADGKVTAVNGNIITVQADNDPAGSTEYTGVTTIVLSDATTYSASTTRASIVVGSYIIAEGNVSSDGKTLAATKVGIGGQGGPGGHGRHGGGGPHADGQVTAVNGNTITVAPDADPAGSDEYTKVTTILLTGTTTYDTGTTTASIVVGVNIVAEGTVSADGLTLTATHVGVHAAGTTPAAGAHSRHP